MGKSTKEDDTNIFRWGQGCELEKGAWKGEYDLDWRQGKAAQVRTHSISEQGESSEPVESSDF